MEADAAHGSCALVVSNTALLRWPTAPGSVMSPVLAVVYLGLARVEEREVAARFGDTRRAYAAVTPASLPTLRPVPPTSDGDAPVRDEVTGRRS
jgi:hypothetical protein